MSLRRTVPLALVPALAFIATSLSAEDASPVTPAPTPVPNPAVEPAPVPTPPNAGTSAPDTVRVVGKHDTDVYPGKSSTANKGDIPTLESPRRVDTITRDLITDLDATTATELWKLIPNAVESERGTVIVRGFTLDQRPQAGAQLFDGTRASVYNLVPVNLYNIERVEMLKGPDGVMYGQGQPGGMVNYVLKKPQRENRNEVSLHVDHFGKKQAAADSTGAIAGDWLYRVNVVGEKTETFRDYEEYENIRVAPSVTWLATDTTNITLLTELFQDKRTGGRGYGTPVRQDDLFAMPREYTIANPDDFRKTRGGSAQLQLNQQLMQDTTLFANLYASRCWYWNQYHEGMRNAAEDLADNPVYRRQYRDQTSDTRTYGYDVHVTWDRPSEVFSHRLLVGTDLAKIVDPQFPAITAETTNPFNATTNPDGATPLDLNNPYQQSTDTSVYGVDASDEAHAKTLEIGAYTNYRLGWTERVFVDVGIRYDDFRQHSSSFNRLTNVTTSDVSSRDHHFNYDAGAVWKFIPEASVYYSYSTGFAAQGSGTIANANGPFDPLEWDQHEAGIQGEALERQLGASLCVFSLTRNHDLVTDTRPGAPTGAQVDIGKTRSEGLETTVRGKIYTNTTISVSYGYDHAYVYKTTQVSPIDGKSFEGNDLAGVPAHTANVSLGHTLNFVPVRLFGGCTYIGERNGRLDPADPLDIELPDYYTVDVAATFVQPNWQMRLGINNLLDRDYAVLYRATGHQVNRSDPRTYTASLTAWF